jgi:hypothetical protein
MLCRELDLLARGRNNAHGQSFKNRTMGKRVVNGAGHED